MHRTSNKILNAALMGLSRGQGGTYNFVSAGEGDLAAGYLADFGGEAIVYFVPDNQKT